MAKTLVTGAGGFIGSHLCEYLVKQGADVRAFVHYNSQNSWGWLDQSSLSSEMEIVSGDLRDYDSVSHALKGADTVYHLGALIGIPYSYVSPLAYVRTNIEGTYNVLEASRQQRLSRVLITSTSEVYGTAQYVPIDEKHPLQPQSPYSATKIGADNLALSYYNSFELPVSIMRPFNTYGPRQSARAVIPTIITQLLKKMPEMRLGSLTPIRDLTFAEDTASGMVTIAKTSAFVGQVVNIGTGEAVSVGDLFERLKKITGHEPKLTVDDARVRPEKSEVHRLISNNDVLKKQTGWQPKHNIQQGLEKTVAWFVSQLDRYKPEIYNV